MSSKRSRIPPAPRTSTSGGSKHSNPCSAASKDMWRTVSPIPIPSANASPLTQAILSQWSPPQCLKNVVLVPVNRCILAPYNGLPKGAYSCLRLIFDSNGRNGTGWRFQNHFLPNLRLTDFKYKLWKQSVRNAVLRHPQMVQFRRKIPTPNPVIDRSIRPNLNPVCGSNHIFKLMKFWPNRLSLVVKIRPRHFWKTMVPRHIKRFFIRSGRVTWVLRPKRCALLLKRGRIHPMRNRPTERSSKNGKSKCIRWALCDLAQGIGLSAKDKTHIGPRNDLSEIPLSRPTARIDVMQ